MEYYIQILCGIPELVIQHDAATAYNNDFPGSFSKCFSIVSGKPPDNADGNELRLHRRSTAALCF